MHFYIIADRELIKVSKLLEKRLIRRGLKVNTDGYCFALHLNPDIPAESYYIIGGDNSVCIEASSMIDILGGLGAFLRDTVFGAEKTLYPQKNGIYTADCAMRGVYFARHFHNFYHSAPFAEICEYIEDLTLWGFNYLMMIMANIDIEKEDSPESLNNIDSIAAVFNFAVSVGMKIVFMLNTSCTYKEYPKELAFTPLKDEWGRQGNSGNVICISKPGGMELIDENNRFLLEAMKTRGVAIDVLASWPYDEGGCGCSECSPWGSNGYIRSSKKAFQTGREYYPNALRLVSTWTFDTPPQGEWNALTKSLEEDTWCDIILADAHEDYPRYPLENGFPGNLPLVSFPEISMWGLYPWGGFGAVCLPERYTRLWRQTERKLYGELLYSEGIYEDLNKCVIAGLCRDYDKNPDETLAEYSRFELGMVNPKPFIELIHIIEKTHTQRAAETIFNVELIEKAMTLACEINESLPVWSKNSWRWRIIFIRTLLETKQLRYVTEHGWDGYVGYTCGDIECLDAMHELIDLFHCLKSGFENDPYHGRVRPWCPSYED